MPSDGILGAFEVLRLGFRVQVRVHSWGLHYVPERLHNDRNINISVPQSLIWYLSQFIKVLHPE